MPLPLVDPLGPAGFAPTRPGPSLRPWAGTQDSYPIHLWQVATTVDSSGVASRTVTKPTVIPAASWVIGFLSGNLAGPPTLDVIPTGFAKATGGIGVSTQLADGTNTYLDVVVRYVPDAATAAAIASETWTVTYSGASKGAYQFLVLTGLDASNPFDGVAGAAESVASGSVTTHSTGAVSPTTPGIRLLQCYVDRLTGGVLLSLQTPYDERADVAAAFPGTRNEIDSTVVLSPPLPAGTYSRTVGVTPNTAAAAVMWIAALRPSSGIVPVVEQGVGAGAATSLVSVVKVAAVTGTTAAAGTATGARGTAATAEQGVLAGAASSTATAVRRAVVSGVTAAAASGSATARKVAPKTGTVPGAGSSTATARHVAVRQGVTPAAGSSTGVHVRRAVEQGSAAAAGSSTAARAAAGARPQTGVCGAAAVGVASVVRVARPAGLAAAAVAGTGTARHVAPRTGTAAAAASSTSTARRVVVGRGTVPAAGWNSAGPRRVALGVGRAVAAGTATAQRLVVVETPASMRPASATVASMGVQAPQTGAGARIATVAGARATSGASSSSGAVAVPASGPTMTGA